MNISTAELKLEIQKVINEIPEDQLPDLLGLLKKMSFSQTQKRENLNKILTEDKELLEKLAQ